MVQRRGLNRGSRRGGGCAACTTSWLSRASPQCKSSLHSLRPLPGAHRWSSGALRIEGAEGVAAARRVRVVANPKRPQQAATHGSVMWVQCSFSFSCRPSPLYRYGYV